MSRKYANVSIKKIMALGPVAWKKQLKKAIVSRDMEFLTSLQYGIQADMTDLEKKKESTEAIVDCFLRVSGSINRAIREIAKRNLKPMFDISAMQKLAAKQGIEIDKNKLAEMTKMQQAWKKEKKEQDKLIEKFIKEKSF